MPPVKRNNLVRKNAILTLGTQAGIQLIGLVTGVLVARLLGPNNRGELAAIIAWVSMLTYLGNLGLPVAYTYRAARETEKIRQLFWNGLLATLAQWGVLMLIGWLVLSHVFDVQNGNLFSLSIIYLCLYVPLNLLTLYLNAIQQGVGEYRGFNTVRISVPMSYLVGIILLPFIGYMSITGVLVANLFSNVVALSISLFLIISLIQSHSTDSRFFDLSLLKRDAFYGISAHIGTVQPFNNLRIDVVFLSILISPHDLGLYMAALAGAGLIKAQGAALGMVVMPEVAKCESIQETA